MIIVDTWAWAEYFKGTKKGDSLNLLIKKNSKLITLESCLAELKCFALREDLDFDEMYTLVRNNSYILAITRDIWLIAAKIRELLRKTMPDFGLMDALIVAKQKELNCKVITGDSHFKKLKNIIYLGR